MNNQGNRNNKENREELDCRLECTPVIWTFLRRMIFWRDLKRARGAEWIRVIKRERTTVTEVLGATNWVKPCMSLSTEAQISAATHGIKPCERLRIVAKILAATYGVKPCEFMIIVATLHAAYTLMWHFLGNCDTDLIVSMCDCPSQSIMFMMSIFQLLWLREDLWNCTVWFSWCPSTPWLVGRSPGTHYT